MTHHRAVLGPGQMPELARIRLNELCTDDGLGLQSAIWVARFRKRHGKGPTFSELFSCFSQAQIPDEEWESELTYSFRHHLAVHWRRQGWLRWSHTTRSLATGIQFQAASAAHRASLSRR